MDTPASPAQGGQERGPAKELVRRSVLAPGVSLYDCFLCEDSSAYPLLEHAQFAALFCQGDILHLSMTGGREISVASGDLFLLSNAAEVRRFSFIFGSFRCLAVVVEQDAPPGAFSKLCPLLSGSPLQFKRLQALLEASKGCMVLQDGSWSTSLFAGLCQLSHEQRGAYFVLRLLERLYLLCSGQAPVYDAPGYFDRYQENAVRNVHNYMLLRLDQRLTVQDLARRFQLSPTLLKSCFRQLYGQPVHAYLQRRRLQMAAHLLRTTADPVIDVAAAVGYSGASRFGAAFKETYHMTPSQYRRRCMEKNV